MLFYFNTGHPSAGLLVPVPPTSDEYWEVFDRLRAPSDSTYQTPDSKKEGLDDAWISSVSRIQNTSLYTYYHFQRDRMLMSMSGMEQANVNGGNWRENNDPSEKVVWHGTGNFDAANIYEDEQDGSVFNSFLFFLCVFMFEKNSVHSLAVCIPLVTLTFNLGHFFIMYSTLTIY